MSELDNLKEIPEWIVPLEDGKYEITIKDKKYIMQERDGTTIEKCERLSQKGISNFEKLLARESLIEPKLTDEEYEKLPGGVYLRLKTAILYVYGLNDFF